MIIMGGPQKMRFVGGPSPKNAIILGGPQKMRFVGGCFLNKMRICEGPPQKNCDLWAAPPKQCDFTSSQGAEHA